MQGIWQSRRIEYSCRVERESPQSMGSPSRCQISCGRPARGMVRPPQVNLLGREEALQRGTSEHVSMKYTTGKPICKNLPLPRMVLVSPSRQGPGKGLRMQTFLPANGSNRMKCTRGLWHGTTTSRDTSCQRRHPTSHESGAGESQCLAAPGLPGTNSQTLSVTQPAGTGRTGATMRGSHHPPVFPVTQHLLPSRWVIFL